MLCLGFGIGPRTSSSLTLWLGLTLSLVERNTSTTMSQRSRASGPSMRNPSSREMISDTVELCETEVCFLHIQLTGTHVLRPKYTRHLLRLTLSRQDLKQSLSLVANAVCNAVPCFTLNNVDNSHLCDWCMKSTLLVVYHMLKSIFWLILLIYSQTTRCQVVQFVPRTSILRQFVSKLLIILQLIPIPPFWTDGRPNKDEKLYKVAPLSDLQIHSIVQRIFGHVLPCRRTTPLFVRGALPNLVIFCCSSRNSWFEHLRISFNNRFIWFAFSFSASQIHMVKKWCRFVNMYVSHQFLPHRSQILILPNHSNVIHTFWQKISLVYDERTYIPTSEVSPIQVLRNLSFSNGHSHSNPAKGCPYKFRSRSTMGSSILSHDFGHLCRGRRIRTSGHSDFGILSNFGASFKISWVKADTAACPTQPGNLARTSIIFAAVICDADEPCSVKTA